MKPKARIFDQNDSFSSYSSNYGYSQAAGRQIGDLKQMIQRTEREMLVPQSSHQTTPTLFQSFFAEGKKTQQQNQVFVSKQELALLQTTLEKAMTKQIDTIKQENELRFTQLLKHQEQQSAEQALGKDNLNSLQLLETRVNLIEKEYMQRAREKDTQIARLEEVQRQLEDKIDQKVVRIRELENSMRDTKVASQSRYDEIKKKLMEVECRLSDCINDNTRLQLSQRNATGQLQTQLVELEELVKISMNSSRKLSDGRKITEEELANKYDMLQTEQENLHKQFISFTNNIDSLLEKQQKQSHAGHPIVETVEHEQFNSIQQVAPILRNSQEYITKEAHDDKYYNNIIEQYEVQREIKQQKEEGEQKQQKEEGEQKQQKEEGIAHKIDMGLDKEEEEEELVYQVDENGYLIDDQGQYILDEEGQFIKFDDQQIDFLEKNDMMQD